MFAQNPRLIRVARLNREAISKLFCENSLVGFYEGTAMNSEYVSFVDFYARFEVATTESLVSTLL